MFESFKEKSSIRKKNKLNVMTNIICYVINVFRVSNQKLLDYIKNDNLYYTTVLVSIRVIYQDKYQINNCVSLIRDLKMIVRALGTCPLVYLVLFVLYFCYA